MMNLYVVTGTSKGLGRALADVLAMQEQNVVIEIGRATSAKNARNTLLEADFANALSIEHAFTELAAHIAGKTFGHAVLINNAGVVLPVARFDKLNRVSLTNNIDVNLTAPILTTTLFANLTRGMARQRLVIGISSGAAKRAIRGWTAYCASKAGLEMATRVMAEEAAAFDPTLTICTLAPGVVDTPMQAIVRSQAAEDFPDVARFQDMHETGALRSAADVARDIIDLIHPPSGAGESPLKNGGNYDLRTLKP
jgi:benzil reductase ((S)-benzoin forming)